MSTDPFHELLCNPPGEYRLTPYGRTHAVILRGDAPFRERGYNLFASMGGEARHEVRFETPLPPLHTTDRADTVWFCLPADRVKLALRLWLYAQLWKAGARDVFDAEGDYLDTVCPDEAALWDQTEQPAMDFIVTHMPPDWRVVSTDEWATERLIEYALGVIEADEDCA